jgi:integrase/recombinase XerD
MTALAPHLAAFLREHLPHERKASPHTCATYAYSFQLMVCFAAYRLNVKPCQLEIEQLDAPLLLAFLKHIETERHNSARTRNARLAAINSFFRFLEYRLPSCLDQSRRIHAVPMKKTDEALIGYLTREEMQALLNVPDPRTKRRSGSGDVAFGLCCRSACVRADQPSLGSPRRSGLLQHPCHGQGTARARSAAVEGHRDRLESLARDPSTGWLPELFPNAAGRAMTRSGFEYILAKHVTVATKERPSIAKKRVTPHVLRHTCAMHTLQATRDVRKVSLWLGHASLQSSEIYLRADPTENFEALTAVAPLSLRRGRFHVPDKLLAMLKAASGSKNYAE